MTNSLKEVPIENKTIVIDICGEMSIERLILLAHLRQNFNILKEKAVRVILTTDRMRKCVKLKSYFKSEWADYSIKTFSVSDYHH